jgi:hypothetical protein
VRIPEPVFRRVVAGILGLLGAAMILQAAR